jgi:hypothetical protein
MTTEEKVKEPKEGVLSELLHILTRSERPRKHHERNTHLKTMGKYHLIEDGKYEIIGLIDTHGIIHEEFYISVTTPHDHIIKYVPDKVIKSPIEGTSSLRKKFVVDFIPEHSGVHVIVAAYNGCAKNPKDATATLAMEVRRIEEGKKVTTMSLAGVNPVHIGDTVKVEGKLETK